MKVPTEMRAAGSSRLRWVLVSAVVTQLMIVLDMTVIAIALPHMQQDLAMSAEQRPWVVTGYSLAFGGLVLFGGKICAVIGIRRSYLTGLIGFAGASMVAGLAPSFLVLVTARAVQGVFGALLAPTTLALVNVTFTERTARGRAFAVLGATGGVGAAVGLLLGGALTEGLSWRWSLYVNVGIAALAFMAGLRSLHAANQRDPSARLGDDILGLILGCGSVFCLVYGLDQAQQYDWSSARAISWLAVGGTALFLFVLREHFAAKPVLPLWVVAHPARSASYATQFIVGAGQMGAIIYLTYYFQDHFGYSPLKTGVVFLPMIGALILTAAFAGRFIVPRLGARFLFPAGLTVQAAAFALFARIELDSTYQQVALPGLIVYGIGIGLTMPVVFNAGTRGVPERQASLASAVLNTAQQIGSSFGVAFLATYATHSVQDYVASHTEGLKIEIAQALTTAKVTPASPSGEVIVRRLTAVISAHAQIAAYSSGFALFAWIFIVAAAIMTIAATTLTITMARSRGRLAVRQPAVKRPA